MTRAAIVVGAGIGGLTAAHALQRTGWRVDVYEQAPAIAPVGAGIGIAPNAVKALDALGLGHQIRSRGRRQAGMEISDQSGRRLLGLSGHEILRRYGAPFYALHRATLHDIPLNQLDAQTLHTGHRATAIATDVDSASVTFATESQESISATADMVIVADGVQSRLRAALFPEYPGPTYAGYTVWRGHVDPPAPQIQPVLSETWGRRGTRFGIAAIDNGIYWFACENLDEFDAPPHRLDLLDLLADRFHATGTTPSPGCSPRPPSPGCSGRTSTTCVRPCPASSTVGSRCSATPPTQSPPTSARAHAWPSRTPRCSPP